MRGACPIAEKDYDGQKLKWKKGHIGGV